MYWAKRKLVMNEMTGANGRFSLRDKDTD
jgi:hypothetical protein